MSNTLTTVLVASLHLDHLATECLARVSGRTPRKLLKKAGLGDYATGAATELGGRARRMDPMATQGQGEAL